MSHSSEPPGNDQIREAALDGVKGASKPVANSAQNRERHIGGHLSGDGPIDPAAAPAGPAPGAQRREVPPPPPAAPDEHLIGLIEKPRTRTCPASPAASASPAKPESVDRKERLGMDDPTATAQKDRTEQNEQCSELPSGHRFERFRCWPIKDRWRCIRCGFVTRHYNNLDYTAGRPVHNHMSVAKKGVNTVPRGGSRVP